MRIFIFSFLLISLGILSGCKSLQSVSESYTYAVAVNPDIALYNRVCNKCCTQGCVKDLKECGCGRYYCNSLYYNTECKAIQCERDICAECESGYYYNGYRENGWKYCETCK